MVTADDMFPLLLRADTSFEPRLRELSSEWRDEDHPPLYLALSGLARHLIAQMEAGNTERFDSIFDVVERWHVEGDAYVRGAATVGLLESLQNGYLHDTTSPTDFIPWLRPETLRSWEKVDAFWRGGKAITDD